MYFPKAIKTTDFGSGSSNTPEFNSFVTKTRNEFKRELKDIATDIQLNKGHFYFYGFLTRKSDNQIFYFSISDVRFFSETNLLIRTAQSYNDWTGGTNQYLTIDNEFYNKFKRFLK